MKLKYIFFPLLSLLFAVTIAQAQKCFDDYTTSFKNRGAFATSDGIQKIVVGVKDASNKSSCFEGQVLVKHDTIVLPVYIKRENGSYTVAKAGFDKMFYREVEGQVSFGIEDGMSTVYMIEGDRKARIFFIDYLKPAPGAPVTAPDIVARKAVPPKKEDLEKMSRNAKSIQFETDKDVITTESYPELDSIAALMKAYPDTKWSIAGYTDNTGDNNANRLLSLNRAEAVESYFISQGVNPEVLYASGLGSSNPIADNKTPEGRKENRRVEIKPII